MVKPTVSSKAAFLPQQGPVYRKSTKPNKRTALRDLSDKTVACVRACHAAWADQPVADDQLNAFMEALYRVCEGANVWRAQVLIYLAPVVFALDAEMQRGTTDAEIPEALLGKAIQQAQLAGVKAWLSPSTAAQDFTETVMREERNWHEQKH